jgi:hypothetical protein
MEKIFLHRLQKKVYFKRNWSFGSPNLCSLCTGHKSGTFQLKQRNQNIFILNFYAFFDNLKFLQHVPILGSKMLLLIQICFFAYLLKERSMEQQIRDAAISDS